MFFVFGFVCVQAQNVLEKKIVADDIETISIDGTQIFTISVSTAKTDYVSIQSILDGEYQNAFQVVTKQENNELLLGLEQTTFTAIADDKRNAHKVIAATLYLEIPEGFSINVYSDVGSVVLNGNFNLLSVELLEGNCEVIGIVNNAAINTMDGNIEVTTKRANIKASSNNGNVKIDDFSESQSNWKLESINGNITVNKQE